MTNTKNAIKKCIFINMLSMLLCITMLVGTTYSWFTDTATIGLNKVESGTLDVALEMLVDGKWVNAEGKTLNFIAIDGNESIYWEPGCTYQLPSLRVINKGNLALKYQIVITGIDSDTKLNEAIEWTCTGGLLKDSLKPNQFSTGITITGHMDENAGNEYQGLTIDGISVTVFATQDTVEHDSFDNQYDEMADFPYVMNYVSSWEELTKALENGQSVKLSSDIIAQKELTIDKNITIEGNGHSIIRNDTYTNTVFHVATGKKLSLRDITITGSADFTTDFIGSTPAVIHSGMNSSPLMTAPAVKSYGMLDFDNVKIINHGTETSECPPIYIAGGSATFDHCSFQNNFANAGSGHAPAALLAKSNVIDVSKFPIGKIVFNHCKIENNIASNNYSAGGAMTFGFCEMVEFNDCEITQNAVLAAGRNGGAIGFGVWPNTIDTYELPNGQLPQAEFNNCLLMRNACPNDGFAIAGSCHQLMFSECDFIENRSTVSGGTSSVGTVSVLGGSKYMTTTVFDSCNFLRNVGAATLFSNHGYSNNLLMKQCYSSGNEGLMAIKMYASDTTLVDCKFENEYYSDTRSTVSFTSEYDTSSGLGFNDKKMTVTIENVEFDNCGSATHLSFDKYKNIEKEYDVYAILDGVVIADINLIESSHLLLEGELVGDIYCDHSTVSNITVNGVLNGSIIQQ